MKNFAINLKKNMSDSNVQFIITRLDIPILFEYDKITENTKKILKIDSMFILYSYETWDNKNNILYYKGEYQYNLDIIPFVLIIKNTNYGKRDSLVLVRKLCYKYNQYISLNYKQQYKKTSDHINNNICSFVSIFFS